MLVKSIQKPTLLVKYFQKPTILVLGVDNLGRYIYIILQKPTILVKETPK